MCVIESEPVLSSKVASLKKGQKKLGLTKKKRFLYLNLTYLIQ